MGLMDVLGKVNDKLTSDKMQDKMAEEYLKGKITRQQYEDYQKAVRAHQQRRGNR